MKELLRRRRFRFALPLAIFTVLLFVLSAPSVQSAEQQPPLSKDVTSQSPSVAIPVPDIAAQATQVLNLLHTLKTQQASRLAIENIRSQWPGFNDRMNLLLEATTGILQEQPTLAVLQAQRQIWEAMKLHANNWLKVLTERAVQIRDVSNRLAHAQGIWTKTNEAVRTAKAPDEILQQIGAVLAAISGAQEALEVQSSDILALQSRVAGLLGRCEDVLLQIATARTDAVSGILVYETSPIWSLQWWGQMQSGMDHGFRLSLFAWREDIQEYLSNPFAGMPLHVGIFIALILILWVAHLRADRWQRADEPLPVATKVLDYPFSAALVGTFFFATGPVSPTPQTVKVLFNIAALIPMIRLARPVIDERIHPAVYALALLFTIDILRRTIEGLPLVWQVVLLLETAAGVLTIGWFLTIGGLRRTPEAQKGLSQFQVLRMAAIIVLFTLIAAFVAGVVGYMRLGDFLASQILGGGALALAFCAYFRIGTGLIAFAIRIWPLRLLRMVQHQGDLLEERIRRVLIWLSVFAWGLRWLAYMAILQPTLDLLGTIMAMNLERGSIDISLGDLVVFFLTVWAAYLLSAFVRFLLREDVYPRVQITSGVSYAISSLLHYVILALGVVVGMGLMGIDLSRIIVLAGAFGVGIGFGLQSVVNNFVCGLILLFERPIHVGDMIEIGDLLGEVRRIGIRASIVRTRQGADIIVPNAQLVGDKVTNWTLSDKLRRLALPVGVNYGASPKKVIEVLVAVAHKTPRILQSPPPRALFMSYGDSSINFELRAWTNEHIDWRQVRSDLAVAVYEAIKEAGMSFPFPQREVRVVHDSPPQEETEYRISNKDPQSF